MPRSNNKPQSPAARAQRSSVNALRSARRGRLRVHAESDWKFPRRARQRVYSTQLEVGLHSALLGSKATKAKNALPERLEGRSPNDASSPFRLHSDLFRLPNDGVKRATKLVMQTRGQHRAIGWYVPAEVVCQRISRARETCYETGDTLRKTRLKASRSPPAELGHRRFRVRFWVVRSPALLLLESS